MNKVERVSDTMFTVDGQLVEAFDNGLWFSNGRDMDWPAYSAILEFIDEEEQNLRILARKSVESLLKELGIKSYRNGKNGTESSI